MEASLRRVFDAAAAEAFMTQMAFREGGPIADAGAAFVRVDFGSGAEHLCPKVDADALAAIAHDLSALDQEPRGPRSAGATADAANLRVVVDTVELLRLMGVPLYTDKDKFGLVVAGSAAAPSPHGREYQVHTRGPHPLDAVTQELRITGAADVDMFIVIDPVRYPDPELRRRLAEGLILKMTTLAQIGFVIPGAVVKCACCENALLSGQYVYRKEGRYVCSEVACMNGVDTLANNNPKIYNLSDVLREEMACDMKTLPGSVNFTFERLPLKLQVIPRIYESPEHVIAGFDIEPCKCAAYPDCHLFTPLALACLEDGILLVTPYSGSGVLEHRALKYAQRGFHRLLAPAAGRVDAGRGESLVTRGVGTLKALIRRLDSGQTKATILRNIIASMRWAATYCDIPAAAAPLYAGRRSTPYQRASARTAKPPGAAEAEAEAEDEAEAEAEPPAPAGSTFTIRLPKNNKGGHEYQSLVVQCDNAKSIGQVFTGAWNPMPVGDDLYERYYGVRLGPAEAPPSNHDDEDSSSLSASTSASASTSYSDAPSAPAPAPEPELNDGCFGDTATTDGTTRSFIRYAKCLAVPYTPPIDFIRSIEMVPDESRSGAFHVQLQYADGDSGMAGAQVVMTLSGMFSKNHSPTVFIHTPTGVIKHGTRGVCIGGDTSYHQSDSTLQSLCDDPRDRAMRVGLALLPRNAQEMRGSIGYIEGAWDIPAKTRERLAATAAWNAANIPGLMGLFRQ